MEPAQKQTLMQFFKATGQPNRLRILGLIANRAYTAPELAAELGMKETAVLHDLRILKQAKLAQEHAATYTLDRSGLETLNNIVAGDAHPPSYTEQVLQKYIVNGRLKSIPPNEAERQAILAWITDKFEVNRQYTETEITEIVAAYSNQPLTLRRILADNRFLYQTGRHYWRPIPGRQP